MSVILQTVWCGWMIDLVMNINDQGKHLWIFLLEISDKKYHRMIQNTGSCSVRDRDTTFY